MRKWQKKNLSLKGKTRRHVIGGTEGSSGTLGWEIYGKEQ